MKNVVIVLVFLSLLLFVYADNTVEGTLENQGSPFFVEADNGSTYQCTWYGGYALYYKGDRVLLSRKNGMGKMIGLTGIGKGKVSKVYIERINSWGR